MAHDRRTARHARKVTPLRRTLLGAVIATAAIAGIVGLGSLFTDSTPDDQVTLMPSPDPSAPDTVDDAAPPENAPSESPTTAATAGASPEPDDPNSEDPGGADGSGGSGGSGPPDTDSPSPDDDAPSDEPSPPRATHPDESPRPDPEPTTPPDPSPSPTSDPTSEPTSDPDPDPTSDPDPTTSPTSEPDPGPSCTAVATTVDPSWFRFDVSVTVTNTSDSQVLGWRSSFTLPSGYRADSAQNANLVESGNSGVVSGPDMISPGESLTYEISGPGLTSAGPPSAITLNDESCA